jgi:aspartyl protease family protein
MIPGTQARDSTVGQAMLWLAAIGLLLGFTWLFQAFVPGNGKMLTAVGDNGQAVVILQQDRSGHYFAEGTINGQPLLFLVDTGATDVAISEAAARELGLSFGPRIRVQTAAGTVPAWVTRLDSVTVGELRLENVRATITPGLGNKALLGMSFLKNFSIRQQDGRLTISAEEIAL